MKFTAKPCSVEGRTTWVREGDDYLAANMARSLKETPACFDFMIQLRTDPASEPIEDPTIEWTGAEYVPVARIEIPLQEFHSEEQKQFCENLSFTPWHSLPEHRPLGGINRMRDAVYEAISNARHGDDGAPREEPSSTRRRRTRAQAGCPERHPRRDRRAGGAFPRWTQNAGVGGAPDGGPTVFRSRGIQRRPGTPRVP
jgi:hypothetical protein